jgi:hypothetical protein
MRPLAPTPELLSAACGRVLGWSRQRVRDDAGLEKLLHEAAVVSAVAWQACVLYCVCRGVDDTSNLLLWVL